MLYYNKHSTVFIGYINIMHYGFTVTIMKKKVNIYEKNSNIIYCVKTHKSIR